MYRTKLNLFASLAALWRRTGAAHPDEAEGRAANAVVPEHLRRDVGLPPPVERPPPLRHLPLPW